jgi:hypothetical protein
VADNDLDFAPDFVFGNSIAAQGDTLSGQPDNSHLAATSIALMCGGCAQTDLRRLPSHTDIFSIASRGLFSNVDAPRREFYGNSNWNNSGNWSGNKVPGAADEVFVRAAEDAGIPLTARLSANGVAANLTVSEGSNVDTDGFKLDVGGDVTVTGLNSDIFIDPGGELEADEVFIQDDAEIEMSGGLLDARIVKTKPAGQLQSVNGGLAQVVVSQLLINNGQIEAVGDSILVLSSLADFPWDLDGDTDEQDGVVDATDGNFTLLDGALADPFDGTMQVGAGQVISIFEPWVNSSGAIDLNGGLDFDTRARISGLLSGTINMTGGTMSISGVAHIDAPVIFFGGVFNPTVSLGAGDTLEFNGVTSVHGGTFTVGNNSTLQFDGDTSINGGTFSTTSNLSSQGVVFNGTTTYAGGTITSTGIAKQEGNAVVNAATTINADIFDMDGTGVVANHSWTINHALTINADSIDSGNNIYHSHITVNSSSALAPGKLTINLPATDHWTLDSASNLIMTGQTNVFSSALAGSDLDLNGTAAITNNVAWDARANFSGAVIINASSNLRLLGGSITNPYTIDGALISGLGTLSTIGTRALVGHGSIATTIDFINQAELRADNGTLTISGTINDVGVLGTADSDGILNITNAWNTSVTDLVDLHGGSIIGSAITNSTSRTIQGFGSLSPNNLANEGTIAASGGTLVIDPSNNLDLDGATENGQIITVNGNLTVVDAVSEHFDGRAVAGPNRVLTFQNGWILGTGGELELDGGSGLGSSTTVAGSLQNLHGNVSINRTARFDIQTRFKSDVAVSLPDANDILLLQQPSTVETGATITGLGTLANSASNTLTLEDGVSLEVALFNAGTLLIGSSLGMATVPSFTQNSLGTIQVELGGTTPGSQHDQLSASGQLNLAGALQITTINGFVPAVGDSFQILTAGGGRSGSFDSATLPTLAASNWQLVYETNSVLLRVALVGDYNFNGSVDLPDYILWRKTLGQTGIALPADGNNNGQVDLFDFARWRANFGHVAPGSGTTLESVPEPNSPTILAAEILLMLVSLRGHQLLPIGSRS